MGVQARGSMSSTSAVSIVHVIVVFLALTASGKTTVTIAPGVEMPMVNLGGVSRHPSNYTSWLAIGGVGLDTALSYKTATDPVQMEVASAVNNSGLDRNQIFVTTKVPCCPEVHQGKDLCNSDLGNLNGTMAQNVQRDLDILGRPVDLLLLHWPCNTLEQTLAAYTALEETMEKGYARAIGVSNFNASLLEAALPRMKIKPAVNQCGHSIGAHNSSHAPSLGGEDGTVRFCAENNITYQAYSPLGGLTGTDIFKDPTVISIGKNHNVSSAQVALRWLIQQGINVVTASGNPEHQAESLKLWDFTLSELEMVTLAGL